MTIEIPDTLAERLRAAAAASGEDFNNYAVARLERSLEPQEDQEDEDTEPDDDLIECLRQGIADAKAGRTISLEELDAHVHGLIAKKAA